MSDHITDLGPFDHKLMLDSLAASVAQACAVIAKAKKGTP